MKLRPVCIAALLLLYSGSAVASNFLRSTRESSALYDSAHDYISPEDAERHLHDYDNDIQKEIRITFKDHSEIFNDEASESAKEEEAKRYLSSDHHDFMPLSCNSDIDSVSCVETTLSSLVGGGEVHVPCGSCAYVDYTDGVTVDLPEGIDVEGKLYFPATANVTIRTTHVYIQGVLQMDPPSEGNKVKFLLFGSEDKYLLPHANNSMACDPSGCNVGKKPIVVAGGKLDIRGLADDTCPSWVKLKDLGTVPFTPADPSCADLVSSNGDASDTSIEPFDRTHGSAPMPIVAQEDGEQFFSIRKRRWSWDGLQFRVEARCLVYQGPYIFRFRYRLHSTDAGVAQIRIDYLRTSDGGKSHGVWQTCPTSSSSTIGWVDCEFDLTFDMSPAEASEVQVGMSTGPSGPLSNIDFDDISIMPKDQVTKIIVDSTAAACWNAGDEVLLTSPDMHYTERITAVIASINATAGILTTTGPMDFPMDATEASDPDYAVEVASLNRRIVFDAEHDDPTNDGLHGGHLIIYRTPTIAQKIQGAEFTNFGQQGKLGRYPIHFHMCGSVAGSQISKNVVHRSHQRGVVIHGTHDVHVLDNVAFEVFGHCFFTEDGVETGNRFERNLGASIRKPTHLIPGESDSVPSVFWITNPMNHWIDNVAAGSEASGFWFDTKFRVRGASYANAQDVHPQLLPIGTFRGNTAHSSNEFGIQYYAPGWQPHTEQIIQDSKVYRNRWAGHLVHGNRNIAIVGGFVADNGIGIKAFRNGNIRLENIKIVGYSDNYAKILAHTKKWWYCTYGGTISGMTIHPWRNMDGSTTMGMTVNNLEFTGFGPDNVCTGYGITMNIDQIQKPVYDSPHRFRNLTFEGDMTKIDACQAINENVENIAIEDLDGSLVSTGTPGFLVSNEPKITTFANGNGCYELAEGCLSFCPNACLRTIGVGVNNAYSTQDVQLVISDGTQNETATWHHFVFGDNAFDHTRATYDASYGVTLPHGDYRLSFRHKVTGEAVWPDYVKVTYEEPPLCTGYAESVDVIPPPSTAGRCAELIKGGAFYGGNFDAWQQSYLVLNTVLDGGDYALEVSGNEGAYHMYVSQWIDVSCLIPDTTYFFSADVRLKNDDGSDTSCNPSTDGDCPFADLVFQQWDMTTKTQTSSITALARVEGEQVNGWYRMSGFATLSTEDASSTAVMVRFKHNKKQNYILDNVSLHQSTLPPTSSPTLAPTQEDPCADLFPCCNQDAEDASMSPQPFERTHGSAPHPKVLTEADGNQYFAVHGRRWWWDGLKTDFEPGCLNLNAIYVVKFRYRLDQDVPAPAAFRINYMRASDGALLTCVGGKCDHYCPTPASASSGWIDCQVEIVMNVDPALVSNFIISFWVPGDANLGDTDFDDFSITEFHIPEEDPATACDDLFPYNGDLETFSVLPLPFERTHGSAPHPELLTEADGNQYIAVHGRRWYWDGLKTNFDPDCLDFNAIYVVRFRYRLDQDVPAPASIGVNYVRASDGVVLTCVGGKCNHYCPTPASTSSGWIDCQVEIVMNVDPALVSNFIISFTVPGDANLGDTDFDDFSITLAESPES